MQDRVNEYIHIKFFHPYDNLPITSADVGFSVYGIKVLVLVSLVNKIQFLVVYVPFVKLEIPVK